MAWTAYRRVTVGQSCDFCLMLATRGAVYSSADVAQYGFGGHRYHDHCDCTVELESDIDARFDVKIDPAELKQEIEFRNNNRTYRYDLTRNRLQPPPKPSMPAPVQARSLNEEIAQLREEYRALLGDKALTDEQRLAKVLDAGDRLLTKVESRVEQRLKSGVNLSKAELQAQKKLTDEVAKLESKVDDLKHQMWDPVDRDFFRETIGRDITLDEYWDIDPKMAHLTPDQLQTLMDRRTAIYRIGSRDYRKAESALFDKRRRLVSLTNSTEDRTGLAWREAVQETLDEVRPMGGKGSTLVSRNGAPLKGGRLKEAIEQAYGSYPTEWLKAQRVKFPELLPKKVRRGYFNAVKQDIALSDGGAPKLSWLDPDGLLDVATHEVGHSMEYSLDDLSRMEWMFLRRRALGTDLTRIYPGEYGFKDNFSNHYTGKVYRSHVFGDRALEHQDPAYEVFTTGMQALSTGRLKDFAMSADGATLDREFLRFMLGVLGLV